jgi:hypothetical protein
MGTVMAMGMATETAMVTGTATVTVMESVWVA